MKLHRCSYGNFIQQQIIGPITWPFFDLLVIHQGQVEIHIANKITYNLVRGEALLIYPNTYFSGRVLSETSLASVQHFSLTLSENNCKESYAYSFMDLSNDAKFYSVDRLIIADIERSLAYNQTLLPDAYITQMQTSLLHLILGQLTYKQEEILPNFRYKVLFNQLVDIYVAKPQQSINIEKMALQLNLSPSHFRAEFQKQFGEPPKRYLLRLRMNAACQLLEHGQLPIKSISASLGYDDIGCFYRHFKKIMKTTPLQYRKRMQVIG
jgi:AraC-like DNA-binding protein